MMLPDPRDIVDVTELPPEHLPGPLPGSLDWQELQLAQIPRWRILARYQRRVAVEQQRERCLTVLAEVRQILLDEQGDDT